MERKQQIDKNMETLEAVDFYLYVHRYVYVLRTNKKLEDTLGISMYVRLFKQGVPLYAPYVIFHKKGVIEPCPLCIQRMYPLYPVLVLPNPLERSSLSHNTCSINKKDSEQNILISII